jgi:hypothetical protein
LSCAAAWVWYVAWCRSGFWWKHGVFSVTFWTMLIDSWMGLYFPAAIVRFPWRTKFGLANKATTSYCRLCLQLRPLVRAHESMHHDRLTALASQFSKHFQRENACFSFCLANLRYVVAHLQFMQES